MIAFLEYSFGNPVIDFGLKATLTDFFNGDWGLWSLWGFNFIFGLWLAYKVEFNDNLKSGTPILLLWLFITDLRIWVSNVFNIESYPVLSSVGFFIGYLFLSVMVFFWDINLRKKSLEHGN